MIGIVQYLVLKSYAMFGVGCQALLNEILDPAVTAFRQHSPLEFQFKVAVFFFRDDVTAVLRFTAVNRINSQFTICCEPA